MNAKLEILRQRISGTVLEPDDEGYNNARSGWNRSIDQRPDLIVIPENEADVIAAVNYANAIEVPITVQSTGHGQPKRCSGGVLVHTAKFNSIQIDASSKTARVGAGTCWMDVINAAYPHGLAPVSGSAPNVGVVGYIMGGGYGITSRKHGLAIDNVREFRIVTPSPDVKVASPNENAELFFAVLGGGGSFGVLTEMTIGLHDHSEVYGGSVMFDASLAAKVYEAYAKWAPALPDEVASAIHLMAFPPLPFVPEFLHRRSMAIVIACVCGSLDKAEEWLRPMRSIEGAEFDSFRRMPYTESGSIFQDPVDPLPVNGRGMLLSDFTHETAGTFLKAIGQMSQSPNLMIQLRHLGGAISRNGDPRSCILRNRRAKFLTYFLGVPTPDNPPDRIAAHAESVFEAIKPWVLSRGPLNWLGEGTVPGSMIRAVFAEDEYERIRSVKEGVDPDNRFSNAGLGIR
jgi:FAD/FMN-containing dehydrogenase